MNRFLIIKNIILPLVVLCILRLLWSIYIPPFLDETYYIAWSKFLSWGYLDHPPGVAFSAYLSNFFQTSSLAPRVGSILFGVLQFLISIRLFQIVYIKNQTKLMTSYVLISAFSISNIIVFALTIPDASLLLFWTVALHECVIALKKDEKRWITAGISTGLGIISKYTMLIIGPIFLIAIISRKKFFTIWPYLGAIACLITISPHINWNVNNEFATYRFITKRGFQSSYESFFAPSNDLVRAQIPNMDGAEFNITKRYLSTEQFAKDSDWIQEAKKNGTISHSFEFIVAQLFLYGLSGFIILFSFFHYLRGRIKNKEELIIFECIDPQLKGLLTAALFIPVAIFAVISLNTTVQTHWAFTYMVSASLFLPIFTWKYERLLLLTSLIHMGLFGAVIIRQDLSMFGAKPTVDRVLQESAGYQQLAIDLEKLDTPLFGDRFQLVSQILFYKPGISITQWPGITRPSEFERSSNFNRYSMNDIIQAKKFHIISSHTIPKKIEGFQPVKALRYRLCSDKILIKENSNGSFERECSNPIKKWYLYQYSLDSMR